MPQLLKHEQSTRLTSLLSPFAKNSRTHSDAQVQQVVKSISEWGFTNPILIDENNIVIAGHCRLTAAIELGIKEVPVVVLKGLSDAQRRAYVIADNKLALNAGWDFDILQSELDELKLDKFDLTLVGFDDKELNDIFSDKKENVPVDEEYHAVFEIIVQCESESEQESLFNKFEKQGLKCRVLSM